ncbi:MAG: SEC-C domain-containing protein [Clostridia bacterium]|nr:SEC-C domain-containing protein [Clostridia bacterium]
MKIYVEWTKKIEDEGNNEFFSNYLDLEKGVYTSILAEKKDIVEGKISTLAESYGMDVITFAGFLDGINSSLKNSLTLDELTEEDDIKLEIDFEKLLYNMHEAKANWLYNLEEWTNIFSIEKMIEIKKQFNTDHIATSNKVGRNEPCPCGSGKKYKKCCGQ